MDDLLRRSLAERVRLEIRLAEQVWPVLVDANQLENALLNLAINARDAMPEGGRLLIETAVASLTGDDGQDGAEIEPGDYTQIRVIDSGVGMSRDVLARVFDPFFTTKPLGQGTGLGLSMIYGFVKQSRGQIRIDSDPGQGTTAKVYLPRYHGAVTRWPIPLLAQRRARAPAKRFCWSRTIRRSDCLSPRFSVNSVMLRCRPPTARRR